jgi:cell division protein FtsI (penicillin-binding protein 3)
MRHKFIVGILLLCLLGLVARIVYLTIIDRSFLQQQSDIRSIRTVNTPAHRGMITDRNGEPLAISTPVDSVWINPHEFVATNSQLRKLAGLLRTSYSELKTKISKTSDRSFLYLQRRITPQVSVQIKNLKIAGLYFIHEYRRYYPQGEVTAHILGFTNIDDVGQEGLELAYEKWLHGMPGKMRVIKDRLGNTVEILATLRDPVPGKDLVLSIDQRIQYLAYFELKQTVTAYQADSGSAIVLDVKTGEILAMVNQPSYNPNNRVKGDIGQYRNRAVTDVFEPGSTMKTFSVASAIESGRYTPKSIINTNPGRFVIDKNVVVDDENINNGILTLTGVLQKSSNIGISKVTLSLPAEKLWNFLHRMGFGQTTQSGFPGESSGSLVDNRVWPRFVLATLSFGYGMSANVLQLTCAYAVLAAGGNKLPVSFVKVSEIPAGNQVLDPKVAKTMLSMLQAVLEARGGGTGTRAKVPGYTAGGKTGTSRIAIRHGYDARRHIASFIGIAPLSDPRLVVAVVVHNPKGAQMGALVAAPAFAKIMGGSLRILNIPPDA